MSKKQFGKKWCWVATETRNGWRLKACIGNRDFLVVGLLLGDEKDVSKLCGDANIVFVHMKSSAHLRDTA